MTLYLGCPIWSNKSWVGSLFPRGTKPADFLREYARRLNTVEGNTTFYAVPSGQTLQKWVAEMPESFRFCPKLPRTISHAGSLAGHATEAAHFADAMSRLGVRLGPMFLQLPPRYPPTLFEDLRAFLEQWPVEYRLAVEVRHADWFDLPRHEALNTFLAGLKMARVVIDTRPIRELGGEAALLQSSYDRLLQARERKPDVPVLPELTSAFVFLRYIGHPRLAENNSFIDEWGDYLGARLRDGSDVYVFCHCPDESLDPALCRLFHSRIAASVPVPPLPWDEISPDVPEQPSLF